MARKRRGEGQTVLITGASGGIGLELARCFARDGYGLVLAARSAEKLAAIAHELTGQHHVAVTPFACDLGRVGAVAELVETLGGRNLPIDVVVNNAGYGVAGALAGVDLGGQLGMIDLNLRALVELTGLLWPHILKSGRGGVLNIASIAAFQPGPFMAVYCATKAFVLSFTEALYEEARGSGARVTCLCPGATATGFPGRAGAADIRLFRMGTMSPRRVARQAYRGFNAKRRLVVPGLLNRLLVGSVRFSPRGMVLRLARWLGTAPARARA